MKFFLLAFMSIIILFSGCTTTNVNQPPVINTFNTSSNAKTTQAKQKSTKTYPGAEQQVKVNKPTTVAKPTPSPYETNVPTTTSMEPPVKTTPVEEMPAPVVMAMATPTPSTSVEQEQQPEPVISTTKVHRPLSHDGIMIKIAVLVPQKTIKKYAITSVNSVMSYLLYKNYSFDLNVFNTNDEREDSILNALTEIKAGGYTHIIAPLTPEGAQIVADRVKDEIVFIPTLNHSSIRGAGSNIVFGGIDYDQQVALLTEFANEKVGTFEDGSALSYQLNGFVKKNASRVFYEKRIENSKANFKQLFKGNTSLNNASLYLNTPLVTTSLIASQLRANGIAPYALLSTQINYNPLLLTLTQYEDRDNMFIANSIKRAPAELEEINALFGHDIVYDWVNYSTTIGTDYLCNQFFGNSVSKTFSETVSSNQVIYQTAIYKPGRNEFIKIQK